jgi:hypothetical protein
MPKMLDAYALKARYYPALLATIPALVALAILISRSKFGLTTAVASTAIPVLVFAGADIARRLGKHIEDRIYAEMGGKPSVTMLRYSDDTFDATSKEQYRAFLSSKVNQPIPTEQQENDDPKAADAFYERGGGWLRENTRSTKKFPVLFAENVTYGYRRNLLGLKVPALATNAVLVLLCAFLLYRKGAIDMDDETTMALLVVAALAFVHTGFMALGASEQSVKEQSRTYARQLILSCESFIGKEKPPARSAKSRAGKQ